VLISMAAAVGMTVTALGMVLTPGPNMMYLVSRSISQGRIAGLISLAGTGIGFVVYMTMANVGLAVVFVAANQRRVGRKLCRGEDQGGGGAVDEESYHSMQATVHDEMAMFGW